MAHYYADSSVLVKRHIRELGTDWVDLLFHQSTRNGVITAQVSVVEVYSAFNRRVREGVLSLIDYQRLYADFDALCANEYSVTELTPAILNRSRLLLEQHPLRAYDAIQLATALEMNITFVAANVAPLTFLSADDRLLDAARAEGLSVNNPNDH